MGDGNKSWLKCHKEMPQNTKKGKPMQYFLIFERSETGVTVLARVVDPGYKGKIGLLVLR